MSCPHCPDQRDAPANDCPAKSDIDDENDPPVWVAPSERDDTRHDVDDAGNEEADAQENDERKVIRRRLRAGMHVTWFAARWRR